MAEIIGVKFRNSGKVYYFSPKKEIFKKGEGVVVETARGVEYGTVSIPNTDVEDDKIVQPLKSVIRKATEKDIEKHNALLAKIPETNEAYRCGIYVRRVKGSVLLYRGGKSGFQGTRQRPCLAVPYKDRIKTSRHTRRNENLRRNRSVRARVLLRGLSAGF